jgi:hypothetical protein
MRRACSGCRRMFFFILDKLQAIAPPIVLDTINAVVDTLAGPNTLVHIERMVAPLDAEIIAALNNGYIVGIGCTAFVSFAKIAFVSFPHHVFPFSGFT